MKIAVCDDDDIFLSQYDRHFNIMEKIIPKLEVDMFNSGEALLSQYEMYGKPYDMIFLDIELGSINGIETAKKIRLIDENVLIIYVTNHTEYVYDSFEVSPFRYMVKPVEYEKLREILLSGRSKIERNRKIIYVTSDRKSIRLCCDEIHYFESQKRIVIIHTQYGNIRTYDKIENWIERLYPNDFISIHKSFLVNMNHISEINQNMIQMVNGDILQVSNKKHRYFKEEYMKFVLRSYENDK